VTDVFEKAKRSEIMSHVRSRGNQSTEEKLAKLLRQAGITGWRRHLRLPGTPDFAFPQQRIAVFVHGCFWHGCPRPGHAQYPKTRAEWWRKKLKRNKERDKMAVRNLRKRGWTVIKLWQCDLTKKRWTSTASKISAAVQYERL
jgi:DNA mismatch endonuclease (patch repair protein)